MRAYTLWQVSGLRWLWRFRVVVFLPGGLAFVDVFVHAERKLWRTYDPDDYGEHLRGCRSRPQDLVVVGGSPVSEGIDPKVLTGVTWQNRPLEHIYNLGLAGGTTAEVWHAVEHGVSRPPRLLVYGITASDVNDRRNEPHGPFALMDVADLPRWVRYQPSSAEWGLRQFSWGVLARTWKLYQYRNGIRLWAADLTERLLPGSFPEAAAEARQRRHFGQAIHDGLGYAPRPQFQTGRLDPLKAAGVRETHFSFLENYRQGEHLRYLRHLLDWAEANGVSVVLLDMPVSADLEERLYPQVFAAYRQALAEVERTTNVTVVRGSRAAVGLTDADFADLTHLNMAGCHRLSLWLRGQLELLDGRTQTACQNAPAE